MTRPPLRTSSRRIQKFLSRQTQLNTSRLPKLPKGTPTLISKRGIPGDLDLNVTSNSDLKAVDDDFAQALRLELLAEKKLKGKKRAGGVTQFPFSQMPGLHIRMLPKKLFVAKEQNSPPVLSKNPKRKSSGLSLVVITSKATVHRFAVVRVRTRRRIIGALDLIVRRGVFPFPETRKHLRDEPPKAAVNDHKPNSEEERILLCDPAHADTKEWILPDWTYIMYPRAEVFRMPLPDLVDRLRLGLGQVNKSAREWQTRYVSPETGRFIPRLSGPSQATGSSLNPMPKGLGSERRTGKMLGAKQSRGAPRYSPDS